MMPYCRWQFGFDVDYLFGAVNDPSVQPWLYNVLGFWMQQQGQAAAWLYSDPFDNSVTNSQFGTGDGVTTSFQLTRSVGSAEDIIQNVNGTPSIYVAGTAESPTVSSTGMVTFAAAPAKGAALTWSGSFYFLCRFIDDKMALQMDMANYWSLSNMRFTSLIL